MSIIYILIYLAAIVLANFLVYWFGPSFVIYNAFILIGLDLTLRDRLHDKWHNNKLWLKMLSLIAAGSLITFLLNQDTSQIALASVLAFAGAAMADTFIYSTLFHKKFLIRANGSNVFGALVDSVLFPTLAFGVFMPWIILGQFAAKVAGGFIWSLIINRLRRKPKRFSLDGAAN